jgi:RNA polymerase sigma factor (sigma-70 family)
MIMALDPVPSTLHTRPSLLFRLSNWQDEKSWEHFYSLYRKLVYGFARKSGLTHEEAEEVTNDVFVRVAKTIHEFEVNPGRGSFRGWLRKLTRWRVNDKFRSRTIHHHFAQRRTEDEGTSTIERLPDPRREDEIWDKEWQNSLLESAMEQLARQAKAKHYQVFDLHIRQQWPVLRISRELGVNPASIYLIVHRLTKKLKQEVAKLKATAD